MKTLLWIMMLLTQLSCTNQRSLYEGVDRKYKIALNLMKRHPDIVEFARSRNDQDSLSLFVSDQLICPQLGGFAETILAWTYPYRKDIQTLRDSLLRSGIDVEGEDGCRETRQQALAKLSVTSDPYRIVFFTPIEQRFLRNRTLLVATIFRNAERKTAFENIASPYMRVIIIFNQDDTVEKTFTYTGDF